jgi:SAM-dependent methyltransferase
MYAFVGDDLAQIPWVHLEPNLGLVAWLNQARLIARGRALVVGCGLGDDAAEVARRGYDVTAFDSSPTAIAWCHKRFPDSSASFHVMDLFRLPAEWSRHFGLLVEIKTIQSIPLQHRADAIAAIAATVAPGGTVFVQCFLRDDDEPTEGPPWPVSRKDLDGFAASGLTELSFDVVDQREGGPRSARSIWRREPGR